MDVLRAQGVLYRFLFCFSCLWFVFFRFRRVGFLFFGWLGLMFWSYRLCNSVEESIRLVGWGREMKDVIVKRLRCLCWGF